jgi:hypothetical protein
MNPAMLKAAPYVVIALLLAAVGALHLRNQTLDVAVTKAEGERDTAAATARGNANALSYLVMERSRGEKIAADVMTATRKSADFYTGLKEDIANVASTQACPAPGVDRAIDGVRERLGAPTANEGAGVGNSARSPALH